MGALPKRKISRVRKGHRRAHYLNLDLPKMVYCSQCHKLHLSHHVCKHCGSYKSREVITIKEKKEKK